jgi:prepilin-type N-terminal cleavage/methylation domain-containing protein
MKISTKSQKRTGFTLIEMVGVLAVIAVLAALLVPKIFTAINEARMNKAVAGVNTGKSAAMMYFGKFGRFGDLNGAPYTAAAAGTALSDTWDTDVLLPLGYLDKNFTNANLLGTSGRIRLVQPEASTTTPSGANSAYNLTGGTTPANEAASGAAVCELVFEAVPIEDARDLSIRIDGQPGKFSTTDTAKTDADIAGRVTYVTGTGNVDVHVYLAHK